MTTRRRSGGARGAAAVLAMVAWSACVPTERAAPRLGAQAPEYGGTTLAGDSVTLESFRGKVVLLNLWATWCAPCRHETPFLQAVYEERRGDGLEIVGVSLDTGDAHRLVSEFVEEYGVTYPILLDPQMRGMDRYQVLGLPATFLIDADGTVRWMRYGPVSETDREFLAALEATLS